ncbi:hypothetical protein TDIS_0100 [Thermosulfurimonas dismutans]|uniref:Rod shape-determining protein MreD n=1 Tax=Thermosulfurimonas dismutans TaxID=999894 RepID=A0A179D811_9BACT|nr:hypothetical protein TDIS_0100 [Thermosulfurimonas dismutans]
MIYLLLIGVLIFKVFLESFTLRYWGDPFLALALAFSLELSGRSRNIFWILVGLIEGFFSLSGILGGFLSGSLVAYLQAILARGLDFSLWYPSLLALGISLFFFRFILYLLFPYLMEISLPTNWLSLLIWDLGVTYAWAMLFRFLIQKYKAFREL